MATITPRVNRVYLNRGADLFFMGEHVAVPFGCVAAKDLADRLDSVGADVIVVEYDTIPDPAARKRDEAKYTRRLASLGGGWSVGPWSNRVVRGFVFPDRMVCELTRKDG